MQTAPGQSGGRPALTDWAEEPVSIGLYGVHQRILALAEASQERAEALRDAVLAAQAHPQPQVEWLGEAKSADRQIRLIARGWWQALNRRYLALPAAREECKALGPGVQALGAGSSNQKAAQSITPASSGWLAQEVWLQVRKQGSPTDALKVELAADSGGAPGSVLGSGELSCGGCPARFPLGAGWIDRAADGQRAVVARGQPHGWAERHELLPPAGGRDLLVCGWGVVGLERFELGEPLPGGGFDLPAGGRDGDQPADAAPGRLQASRRWVGPSSGERAAFSAIRIAAVCVR